MAPQIPAAALAARRRRRLQLVFALFIAGGVAYRLIQVFLRD